MEVLWRGLRKSPHRKDLLPIDKTSLPEDMVFYRGTSTDALGSLKNLSPEELIGKTFTEDGFMSTTRSCAVAQETFLDNMFITIKTTKGTKALDISSISAYEKEEEILFNSGQEMLIISSELKNKVLYITVVAK